MARMIFVNLPVTDLSRSIAFYEAVGATLNPDFTDETAACMVFSDTIHVMLLTHPKFAHFAPRPIADARAATGSILCISCESREAVDEMVGAAAASGGVADIGPTDEYGFMYGRNFEDPDGHLWAPMWMDLQGYLAATGKAAA